MKDRLISIGETAELLGVSVGTLRRWDREGALTSDNRTAGNHRRYWLGRVLSKLGKQLPGDDGLTVCYARVSSHDQKADLERQGEKLLEHCAEAGLERTLLIKDLGSGLNYRKAGLKKLLRLLLSGKVSHLVINYKDRLLRFGSELIFCICDQMSVEVSILEQVPTQSVQESLCGDVIELMTVFSSRLYGMRSHQNRRKAA
jgi:predicted site-specific integrase-resolvase